MSQAPPEQRLTGPRKAAVLVVPWGFLAVFVTLIWLFLLPRAFEGQFVAACMTLFVGLVFASFLTAAITFSGDVLADRWP